MDFVEIALDPTLQSQPLRVRLQGQAATVRFNVQVWELGSGYTAPRAATPEPEVASQAGDGGYTYVVPKVNAGASNRLALIITRLDSDEGADPVGGYIITLDSAG